MLVAVLLVTACGTAVPNLKGMTIGQAKSAIETAGFKIGTVEYDERSADSTGSVTSQVPAAGGRAAGGSILSLTVAGPPPVPAPNLAGLHRPQAEAALVAAGFALGAVSESYDASVAVGDVVTQVPAPGVEAQAGATGVRRMAEPNVVALHSYG